MLCAYEIIEYFYSVAKPYCRKKKLVHVQFFKKTKIKTSAKITWYW